MALELMSLQYNKNRAQLHKLMQIQNNASEPISSIINIQHYLFKDSDVIEVKRLVREQIKINKLMIVGRSMITQTETKN
jgi:hypothetical protein